MVRFESVTKIYPNGTSHITALSELTLNIPTGLTVIAGPSGCGKSTIINLIGGLDTPDSGAIFVDDKDISTFTERERDLYRRKSVGIIFQFFHLIPTLTVLENIILPAEIAGEKHHHAREYAEYLLEQVDLQSRGHSYPHQISGGEIQRAAIARALINEPSLILADEPTGNLDSKSSEKVLSILTKLLEQEGRSAIIATHDPEVVKQADQMILLFDGRVTS